MRNNIRPRSLPEGWYPASPEKIIQIINSWNIADKNTACANSIIVPHAGWFYSGELAFKGFLALPADIEIIVVAGGHLGENDAVLAAKEDYFNATIGVIQNDIELLNYLTDAQVIRDDIYRDNTVEIHLPIIKYLFPEARVVWLRVPPNSKIASETAKNIFNYASANKIKIAVSGSTDLTHYGDNFRFTPYGTGKKAFDWVTQVNDKQFINYLLEFNAEDAVKHSLKNFSACSSGGAALASEYARLSGSVESNLINYYTSFDIASSDNRASDEGAYAESFVGYCAISYC